MRTEALWRPERTDEYLFILVSMGRSLRLQLLPVWFQAGVYELAEACRLPPRLWVSEDHKQKDIESLHVVSLMDESKMRNHRKRETDSVCYLGCGEKIRMLLTQTTKLSYSQLLLSHVI